MGVERRRSKRIDIDVTVALRQLGDNYISGFSSETVTVNVIDISKDGVAFKSDYDFKLNSYYNTVITLENKESFEVVIEVVRKENRGEKETTYGCRFVGINADDQFKIEVYQIVNEHQKEEDKL